jgi:hypothetical protein
MFQATRKQRERGGGGEYGHGTRMYCHYARIECRQNNHWRKNHCLLCLLNQRINVGRYVHVGVASERASERGREGGREESGKL